MFHYDMAVSQVSAKSIKVLEQTYGGGSDTTVIKDPNSELVNKKYKKLTPLLGVTYCYICIQFIC